SPTDKSFHTHPCRHMCISGISHDFSRLSRSQGQVTHVLLTRSPLIHPASWASSFDLHVLSTPPAFVLSQDQTLRKCQSPPQKGVTTIRRHPPPKPAAGNPGKPTRRNEEPRDGQPNKQPMTPAQPKPDQRHRSKWHQKLGTLLSSQETDTHRLGPTSWSTPRPGLPFYFTRRRSHTQPLVGVTPASESRTRLTRLRPLLAVVSGCRSGTGHRAAGPLCPCLP